jgi:hypothetical protein
MHEGREVLKPDVGLGPLDERPCDRRSHSLDNWNSKGSLMRFIKVGRLPRL